MSHHRSIRYDRLLQVRVPGFLSAALDVAARRRGSKPSEYLRQAVLAAVRSDGVALPDGYEADRSISASCRPSGLRRRPILQRIFFDDDNPKRALRARPLAELRAAASYQNLR
jgi:hypothetical protein